MQRNALLSLVLVLFVPLVSRAQAQVAPAPPLAPFPPLVLTNAVVIDGVASQPLRGATIVIRDGRIERIASGLSAPAGATVIDLGGRWVVPGFIDAHVHISNLPAARLALASGVTTARSLGVDHFADKGIRELHRAGAVDLPDILASGTHVRPRPSDALFMDHPQLSDLLSRGVSGPANIRRVVRALIDEGADVIKILATERAGLPDTDPRKRVFTEEELAAAVDEARTRGRPVAAHAHGDEGAMAAVRAGARTIEHGTYLSTATLTLMKERGTCFVPTIATVVDLTEPGGDYDNATLAVRGRAMLPRVREASARAAQMGVRVVAGTDTRYDGPSTRRMQDEIAELERTGLGRMDAIRTATSVAAQCLGIDGRTGSLRPGLEADLIVVDRDPLADIEALRDIVLVVNNGRVAVNKLVN